jgi:D-alanyl-D-alanine carboxypeptidase
MGTVSPVTPGGDPTAAGPATPSATALTPALRSGVVSSPLGSPVPSPNGSPVVAPVVSPAPSTTPDPIAVTIPFDDATAGALQAVLDAARVRIPTPGISVAIRLADGRTWLGVSGNRRLSPARAVDPATVFSIASITKTFVTAVVMQLVAEGRLGLDDRLSRFLPGYPRGERITIRQLLSHTSGIANYFESPAYNDAVFGRPDKRWKLPQILGLVGRPYCRPGRCFHYSNTNFVLLGRIVERVTGKPVARVIRDRLLDPLGLERTSFQPDEPTPRDAAHGHLWAGGSTFIDQTRTGRVLPNMSAATVAWTAGAMVSDAADLARWALALYGTDQVVEPALLDQMLTFRKRDEYGLGTRTRIFDGRRAVGHGGSLRGYEDGMWYFPREGAVIVLLSNRGLYNPDRTLRQLARTLWHHIDVPPPEYDRTKNTH